jgi:hypothetical protein
LNLVNCGEMRRSWSGATPVTTRSGAFSVEIADKVMDKVIDKVQHDAKRRNAVPGPPPGPGQGHPDRATENNFKKLLRRGWDLLYSALRFPGKGGGEI